MLRKRIWLIAAAVLLVAAVVLIVIGPSFEKEKQFDPSGLGLPSCGEDQEIFTVAPVDLSDLTTIVPLGNFNPTGHVFPTPHLYFAPVQDANRVPKVLDLASPASMWITSIRISENVTKGRTDYSLYFSPCREVQGYFFHIQTLSEELQKAFTLPYDYEENYSAGGDIFHTSGKQVKIEISAGELLGTVGGNPNVSAFDFGLLDFRISPLNAVNPARWAPEGSIEKSERLHTVCALDYFTADLKATLKAKLGDWNGNRRATEPICGEVMQDAGGTASGAWFLKGTVETFPEDPHLTFAHSNFDVRVPVFSVGTSLQKSGLPPGVYEFIPKGQGFVNLNPDDVFPNGKVYCYDLQDFHPTAGATFVEDPSKIRYSVILRLLDEKTMRMENLGRVPCRGGPWEFSANATDFER